MRKETLLVIVFLVIVLGTSALIWSFALPDLRPLALGEGVSGTVVAGAARQERALDPQEIATLNHWFADNRRGWAPLTKAAPSSGDAVISLVGGDGAAYRITLFLGLSGSDWNDTVVVQTRPDAPFRVHAFPEAAFAPLRHIAEQGSYAQSAPP